jgi:endonuclease/exonuclease/phosphatase family metal-dependent hydrolase
MHQPDAATGCCWSRRELSWVVGKNAGGTQTNVPIFYDGLKWDVIEGSLQWLILPSGLRKRYATFAKFMSRSTGGWVWICSAHLASGGIDEPKEVQLRDKQIQMIYDYIRTLDDPDRIAILVDANSLDEVPAFMNAHGYKTIHTKLPDGGIENRNANTFNGWKKTRYEKKRIDYIFSGTKVKVVAGAILLTDPLTKGGSFGSDHNGEFARLSFLDQVGL